jgi:hypothetical protein
MEQRIPENGKVLSQSPRSSIDELKPSHAFDSSAKKPTPGAPSEQLTSP